MMSSRTQSGCSQGISSSAFRLEPQVVTPMPRLFEQDLGGRGYRQIVVDDVEMTLSRHSSALPHCGLQALRVLVREAEGPGIRTGPAS